MKFSVSNIAWPSRLDAEVATLLSAHGVSAIEAAPGKINADPAKITFSEASRFQRFWADRGIGVAALQALFFGGPTCSLFSGETARNDLWNHLVLIGEVAATLDAPVLVFGSPRNRAKGDLRPDEALRIAADFFVEAADRVKPFGVKIVIEPIPKEYGCDFLNTSAEALQLVAATEDRVGMHLDTGCMMLAGEVADEAIAGSAARLCHFHVSEEHLLPIGAGSVEHEAYAKALIAHGYDKTLSIEMRETSTPLASLEQALTHVRRVYG